MLFGIAIDTFSLYPAGAGAVNMSSVSGVAGSVLLFNTLSSVILNNPNISSSSSTVFCFCPAILSVCGFYHNCFVCKLFFFTAPLLQGEPIDTLPNVTTLDLAQVATKTKT